MSTNLKLLIVVTGATGAQGGSVVKFLLQDGTFRIRAVTRNVESPSAKELLAKGVEVVQANYDDPATMLKAFKGAYGVFGVTNYWEFIQQGAGEASAGKETAQGKTLVDAAKAAGVRHFVWSTLDHTAEPFVAHWNSKAAVDDYLKASGVPRTSLYTSFFLENFQKLIPMTKSADGSLEANWPMLATDGPIGVYAVADTGAWVLESFKHPDEWIGKDLRVISDIITPRDFVKLCSELSGKPIKLHEVSAEAFESLKGVAGYADVWENLKWFYLHNGCPNRDIGVTLRLYPDVQRIRGWVQANLSTLTLEA